VTEYVLRRASADDSVALYALHRAALGSYIIAIYGPWDDSAQRSFHRAWFDPDRLWVIESGGQLIGVLDYTFHDDHVELRRITIHPDYQNRGIGTSVLTDLLARADERGLPTTLEVFDVNPAIRLYERLGFIKAERVGHKVHMTRFVR
jgi:ribosomal protein S18 acetylase RimI-like enzyme